MPSPFFACSARYPHLDVDETIKSFIAKEYFSVSDVTPTTTSDQLLVNCEKTAIGSSMIVKTTHPGSSSFAVERSWNDVREDSKKGFQIWLPIAGKLRIAQHNRDNIIGENEIGVICTNKPFRVKTLSSANSEQSVFVVTLPHHLVIRCIHNAEQLGGFSKSLADGHGVIFKHTIFDLFNHGDQMSESTSTSYLNSALSSLSEILSQDSHRLSEQMDIKAVRFQQVMEYIDFNLSNQGLTASRVAQSCDMSSRYVHFLFNRTGTTFSEYVWKRRLQQAHDLLSQNTPYKESITEIAFKCGFRSNSHFSRSFKATFGIKPSEVRKGAKSAEHTFLNSETIN